MDVDRFKIFPFVDILPTLSSGVFRVPLAVRARRLEGKA